MTLKVKVQVDRLPDVTPADGSLRCQLGIRVSAVMEPDPAIPTTAADAQLLQPWLWKAKDDPAASWNAHAAGSWMLWRYDGTSMSEVASAICTMRVADPDFDGAPRAGLFSRRIGEEVDDIVATYGIAALEAPRLEGIISGRTVYGLVESLTALPSPVPACMHVWTVITLDSADLAVGPDDQFFAIPLFGTPDVAVYAPPAAAPTPSQAPETPTQFDYTAPAGRAAVASVFPSLSANKLKIPGDSSQLIDLASLLVRPGSAPFEGSDWSSDLALRIAETLDPSARLMSVLDEVVRKFAGQPAEVIDPAPGADPAASRLPRLYREVLAIDLGLGGGTVKGADYLRKALAAVHWQVVGPRTHSSRPTAAPAASFIERLAGRSPQLWSDAMLMLLAQAAADTAGAIGSAGPMVLSRSRLADAAGIVVARKDMLDEPDAAQALDNESAFRDWLADHWTTGQPASTDPASESSYLFAGLARDVKNIGGVATAVSRRTGLIDLMRQPAETELRIPLSVRLGGAQPESLQFRLGVSEKGGAAQTVSLHLNPFKLRAGGKTLPLTGAFADGTLVTLVIERPEGFKVWTLGVGIEGPMQAKEFFPGVADISPLAVTGKLMLAVSLNPDAAGSLLQVDVDVANAPKRLRAAVVQGVQPQAMRAGLALAYSGPVIAGIMGGWVPVDGVPATIVAGKGELSTRLADSMSGYIDMVFSQMEKASLAAIPIGTPGKPPYETGIRHLLGELWSAARADAKQRAKKLIPSDAGRGANRVTPDAIPLSFAVDELQDFDDTVDLWTRLAGLGVLIGRDDSAREIQWWSLNAASLHAPQLTRQVREELAEANAVVVDPAAASWEMQALVDPVPLVVTESQGVRNAVIHYESQSIVAEVQKRPQLDPHGKATSTARRPEAYLFPVDKTFPKLPPLTFGRTYHILPYLIGHGGAMPPLLRGDSLDPTSRIKRADTTGYFRIDKEAIKGWARKRPYLRTVPVAAPRLSDKSRVPGLIEGVESLAAELPVIPPSITLMAAEPTSFFVDRDQVNGLLFCPFAGTTGAGIRIDIAGIDCSGAGTLTVSASQHESGAPVELVEVRVDLAHLRAKAGGVTKAGIRVEIIDDQVSVWALVDGEAALAEDGPAEKKMGLAATAPRTVGEWQGACVALSVSDDVDVVPPSIRWGRANAAGMVPALLVEGDKPLFPAELVPQSRSISILDGIGAANMRTGPTSVLLAIKRPTASMATYDRWINGAISDYGSASDTLVAAALNDAAARTTRAGGPKGEKVLDDPAVQALVVEVIQLFPKRLVVSLERLDTAFHDTQARLMGNEDKHRHGAEQAFVAISVADSTAPPTPRAYPVTVQPGCCYEIRIYGAVAKDQPWFAPISNRARFAPAATAGWRDVTIKGALLHLGAPLVHTVEVASAIMPELYSAVNDPLTPFFITMQRPPMRARDMAAFHLLPSRLEPRRASRTAGPQASDEERYQALRMVDRLALIEQRWSWRGRPHPELGRGGGENFGERDNIDPAYQEFSDMAFLGRSHDDIGPIKEKRIARNHVFGGCLQFPTRENMATLLEPIFLESELDYRGGANLWRFAIRAKSRYAAMRNDSDSMLSFSHAKQFSPKVNWIPLLVPDRVHPSQGSRKPKRPGLMLVAPLTEPMSAEGTVPPLLALFNEPMFPLFHVGDGIEAVIEVARHPYPGLGRIDGDDAARNDFKTSWEQLETLRKDLQTASDELRAMLAVDAVTGLAAQDAALLAVRKQEKELREAVELHGRMAGTAMALAYTKKWEELAETLWGEVMELEAKQADTLDPVKKDTLTLKIQRFKERYKKLKPEIAIAKSAEPHGHTRGADSRAEGSPLVKYWPEFAPDPVRTGEGADGTPVAMRCDGPIGYGFDFDVQAGRFDHAGLLISPVGQAVRPWSMVKMRFRRLEIPEFLVDGANVPLWKDINLLADGADQVAVTLSSSYPDPDTQVANVAKLDIVQFNTPHEGLALDLEANSSTKGSVKVSLDANPGTAQEFTQVDATVTEVDDQHVILSIAIATRLGASKAWTKKVSRQAHIDVRLIVSQQFTMPDVPPRGDVSVRVRITPGSQQAGAAQADEYAWLSVICAPLTASAPPGAGIPLVYLHGGATSHPIRVRPVRLSEFTDGVWCQFGAAMSRIVVSAVVTDGAAQRKLLDTLVVTDLVARKDADGSQMSITLRQKRPGETISDIAFAAEGKPDADAQLEECLFAVITRYVHDAFDRLRECPNSIHPMNPIGAPPGSPALGAARWTNPQLDALAPFTDGKGRIRILRVLRGKTKADGGFESATKNFPQDFFGADVEAADGLSMNPLDGAGQVLGISKPFEWE